jgi:hypothetical protein
VCVCVCVCVITKTFITELPLPWLLDSASYKGIFGPRREGEGVERGYERGGRGEGGKE